MKTKICLTIFTGTILLLATNCKKEEPVSLPVISTAPVFFVTTSTASAGGSITSDGRAEILAKGVCWNTTGNPTINNDKTVSPGYEPQFICNLSGLSSGTEYHVKAYATNSVGTAYGDDITFSTLGGVPAATTQSVTNLSSTGATLNGLVNADGLSTTVIFEYYCYSSAGRGRIKVQGNMAASQSPVQGTDLINVNAELSGLTPGRVYNFRVKADNFCGTVYGEELSFIPQ